MSIRDFYIKLTSSNEENSLLASLRRLSLVEDPSRFSDGSADPASDWMVWNQPSTECPSTTGA